MSGNLDPILLFTVTKEKDKRGIFYLPQRGVGMDHVPVDGSIRSVAKFIINSGFNDFDTIELEFKELSEQAIIQALTKWVEKEKKTT